MKETPKTKRNQTKGKKNDNSVNIANDGAIKEQYLKAANVKKRQCCLLDIKHALEQWPIVLVYIYIYLTLGLLILLSLPIFILSGFHSIEHFIMALQKPLGENITFQAKRLTKITTILMVALPHCCVLLFMRWFLAGWLAKSFYSHSFSHFAYHFTAHLQFALSENTNNNARIFFSRLIYSSIFCLLFFPLCQCLWSVFSSFSYFMFACDSQI